MADDNVKRVTLDRVDTGVYRAVNARGNELQFGSRDDDGFTPVELLLAAIGGCSSVDVDIVTGRRAEPEQFKVDVEASYVRDDTGNILRDIQMTFRVTFPEGEDGDKARDMLPRAARTSHDRTCTVSRTIEGDSEITVNIAE